MEREFKSINSRPVKFFSREEIVLISQNPWGDKLIHCREKKVENYTARLELVQFNSLKSHPENPALAIKDGRLILGQTSKFWQDGKLWELGVVIAPAPSRPLDIFLMPPKEVVFPRQEFRLKAKLILEDLESPADSWALAYEWQIAGINDFKPYGFYVPDNPRVLSGLNFSFETKILE